MPEKHCISTLFELMELFKFYRAGGLTCKVVEYAVYAFDFVYYSGHDFV